ncbi:MAG: heme transporter CcmB [Candidatus Sericytochromatia bacterium]|nr:MAG: heme transporter CcmB [Candidatus Sericytochromatia bacterium]
MKFEYIIPTKSLWQIAFRPFFLFGSIYSIFIVYFWISFYSGNFKINNYYNVVNWHAHEMIFGFVIAIVTGFIFTASANWTAKEPLKFFRLKLLFFFWIVPRILSFICKEKNIIIMFFDLFFYLLLIYYLYNYFSIENQRKNRIFILLFFFIFISNFIIHLEIFGFLENFSRKAIMIALSSILMMITIITGRIIPFFTKKAILEEKIEVKEWIEKYLFILSFLFIITNSFFESKVINSLVCFLLTFLHFERFRNWHPIQTAKIPILWILFIGYFWFILGFFMKGISLFLDISYSLSTHLLTLGGMSVIIYGMITRVSLGHTGRPIVASKVIVLAYYIINLSVFIRVFIPLFLSNYTKLAINISGFLWILVFSIFIFKYWKILVSPRIDGLSN